MARRFVKAWNDRDPEAIAQLTHNQGEILLPRNLLKGGSHVGPAGARRARAEAAQTREEVRVANMGEGKLLHLRPLPSHAEALEAVRLSE